MSTETYGLQNDASRSKKVSSTQWNKLANVLELVAVELAEYTGGGFLLPGDFNLTPTGGTAKTGSVSTGRVIVGASGERKLVHADDVQNITCIGTNASPQTNYGYVTQEGTITVVQNPMDAPANSMLAWSCLCNDAGLSSVDQTPTGRINIVSLLAVKVSSNDAQAGYLDDKVLAGTGITKTVNNDGENETVTLAVNASAVLDGKVKSSADDGTSGYLFDELVAGTGMTITLETVSGQKKVQITNAAPDDRKVKASSADVAPDFLDGKIIAGTNITITVVDGGGGKQLQIAATGGGGGGDDEKVLADATDAVNGYLDAKIIAGDGISVSVEDGVGGARHLVIEADNAFDQKVKVEADDTESSYLADKLTAGTNVTLTVLEDGDGVKSIQISADGFESSDVAVRTSEDDTESGYLMDKIVAGDGISVTEVVVEGERFVSVALTDATTDQYVKTNEDDDSEGYLADKLTAGVGVALDVLDTGGVKRIRIRNTRAEPYDVAAFCVGEPTASQRLLKFTAPREITFADDFAGSYGNADTAATGSTVFNVRRKVGAGAYSTVGTITFAGSGTSPTFATSGGALVLAAGDTLIIEAPGTPDATLADVSFTLVGSVG